MINAVRNKASSIVHAVTDFLPGSPAKEGPLSGKGYVVLRARRFMNDFAKGINDGSQKPSAALLGAINPTGACGCSTAFDEIEACCDPSHTGCGGRRLASTT